MLTMDDKEFSEDADNLFASYHVVKRDAAFVKSGDWLLMPYGPPRRDGFDTPPQFADLVSPGRFLMF